VGLRLAAAAFDWTILIVTALFTSSMISVRIGDPPSAVVFGVVLLVYALVYWPMAGGVWGSSYGKRQCGLQIVTTAGGRVGIARAFLRSVVALLPLALAVAVMSSRDVLFPQPAVSWAACATALVGSVGLLFSTARARNGYVGRHDQMSGTRVIMRTREAAARPPIVSPVVPGSKPLRQVGPYDVLSSVGATGVGEILLGFDPRLKRQVWIHEVSAQTREVPAAVRDLSRPGRLHWLNGHRGADRGWDAYDVPTGAALMTSTTPLPWTIARRRLLDLARELDAALKDGSFGVLSIDRVWITSEGRTKLLDFRGPVPAGPAAPAGAAGTAMFVAPTELIEAQRFLRDVASHLLGTAPPLLPLSAASLLRNLADAEVATMGEVVTALERMATQPDRVTQAQRSMSIALCVVSYYPSEILLARLLTYVGIARAVPMPRPIGRANTSSLFHALTAPHALSAGNIADITCAVLSVLFAAVLVGGFWLRVFGIAVVTRDGREASRLRAAWRAVMAWSWVPVQIAAMLSGWSLLIPVIWAAKVAGMIYAGWHPEQGAQDHVAGTYLVPR
jgi:uncharacterized RDD family membrane protein YckC